MWLHTKLTKIIHWVHGLLLNIWMESLLTLRAVTATLVRSVTFKRTCHQQNSKTTPRFSQTQHGQQDYRTTEEDKTMKPIEEKDSIYLVKYRDRTLLVSRSLLKAQGKSSELNKIKELHKERLEIEHQMETRRYPHKELGRAWTEVQYEIQVAWGFPKDIRFHKFWEIPSCTCPKAENINSYPSGYYFYSKDCKIHGNVSIVT